MVTGDRSRHRIPRAQALPLTVGDVMVAHPKTFRSDITVNEVRQAFEQSSQRVVLLVDGSTRTATRFAGCSASTRARRASASIEARSG